MYSKELIEKYVTSTLEFEKKQRAVEQAFGAIDAENIVSTLVPYEYYDMVNQLVMSVIGEEAFETLMWWMYDVVDDNGNRSGHMEDETGSITVTTFEELYAIVFEKKPISDILKQRVE